MRKDRTKLQINRQLRSRSLLDQIRPHGLVNASYFTSVYARLLALTCPRLQGGKAARFVERRLKRRTSALT